VGLLKSFFFDKRPLNVGCRVENVFYLKDFVTWLVCEMLSDISLGGVFYVAFCNYHVGAPCFLTDSQIHGLINTGRFLENPLVGRHVDDFKVGSWLRVKFP